MIRINRPTTIPKPLDTSGRQLRNDDITKHTEGTVEFFFDREVYGHAEVKVALRTAQYDKCCFCESKICHIAYGDVEHFRPKAAYRSEAGTQLVTPGYFWLAYEWSNLLFSCEICNRRQKGNLFPLADESFRVRNPQDEVTNEKPLFLDPSAEDPSLHIQFREEFPYAVNGSKRGQETIQALGLDRAELVERRRDRLKKLRYLREAAGQLHRKRSAQDKELAQKIDAELRKSVADDAEYAAMARQLDQPMPTRKRGPKGRTRPRKQ